MLEEEAVHTIDEFVKTWMEVKAGCWGAVCGVGGVLPALGAPPDNWGFVAQIPQGEEQKMKFLESICSVCTTARESGLSGGFADFCNRCNLCRHLQVSWGG